MSAKFKKLADELQAEAMALRQVSREPPPNADPKVWRRSCKIQARAKEDAARRIRLAC